jgi:hypothetical protein
MEGTLYSLLNGCAAHYSNYLMVEMPAHHDKKHLSDSIILKAMLYTPFSLEFLSFFVKRVY